MLAPVLKGLLLGFLYESVGNNLRFSHFGGGNDIDTTGYNMINIIANRMKLSPQSSIVLTGTTDGKELSSFAKRIGPVLFEHFHV